jgi:pimeloyl-ACP methyl ester carboxylesterase
MSRRLRGGNRGDLSGKLRLWLLWALARISPRRFEQRFVQRFLTPRRPIRIPRIRPDLPPPDEMMRIKTGGGGQVPDEWVAAWRWGNGPAVMLVHGWEDDHHCFDAMIAALVKRGQAVVAFDLPAHGQSGGTRMTFPFAAKSIRDVAAALGPVRAIAGHSMGGAASALAIASGFEVERAAIIAAPVGPMYALNAVMKRIGVTQAGQERVFEELRRYTGFRPEELELMPKVATFDLPALIVQSKDDPTVRFVTGQRWAETWPGAQFFALEKLGHRKLLFDPPTAARIADFLAQPKAASAQVALSA